MAKRKKSAYAKMLMSPELKQARESGNYTEVINHLHDMTTSVGLETQETSDKKVEEEEVPNDPVNPEDEIEGGMMVDENLIPTEEEDAPGAEIIHDIVELQKTVERLSMEMTLSKKKIESYEKYIRECTEENAKLREIAAKVPNLAEKVKELEIENARLEFENSQNTVKISAMGEEVQRLRTQAPAPRRQVPIKRPIMGTQRQLQPPSNYATNGYDSWN